MLECPRGLQEIQLDVQRLVQDFRDRHGEDFPSTNGAKEEFVYNDTEKRLRANAGIYMPILDAMIHSDPDELKESARFVDGRHRAWALSCLGHEVITVLVPSEKAAVFIAVYGYQRDLNAPAA